MLITSFCKSQNGFGKHYVAGVVISGSAATAIYSATKKPLLSAFLGSLVGGTVGLLKEEVYDRNLQRGHATDEDKIATFAGSFFIILPFTIITSNCRKKQIDTTEYSFKN